MTALALVLGITDLVLLATIMDYGRRISELEKIGEGNRKKWEKQDFWDKYVSKKIEMVYKKLGMFPYDGRYVYNDVLETDMDLNPPREFPPDLADEDNAGCTDNQS